MNKFFLQIVACLIILSASSNSLRNLYVANCGQHDANGNCLVCSWRYVLSNGQCIKVSDDCRYWD